MAKSPSDNLTHQVSGMLKKYFPGNPFFILGVSGGPDSMALMYLLHKLRANALIVHINYAKRGNESDLDQELTEQLAFEWGFECCSLKLNPEDAKNQNFQNWAREQRYQFFRDLKAEYDADAIVLAHHQDDQIETILQKLFRGSSPSAWQGMQVWDEELFRPLLTFTKQQIIEFCEEEAIPYRVDKSNETTDYARNLIRNELSAQLDELLPGWKQHVLNLPQQGKLFESSIEYITQQVHEAGTISHQKFKDLPEILKPAVLKTIFDHAGLERDYSKGKLLSVSDIENLQTGKSYEVGDYFLTRDRDKIRLHPSPGNNKIEEKISRKQAQKGWQFNQISLNISQQKSPCTLIIDETKIIWPLILRNWESGDSFSPLGMKGSQKVSDHLTNRKIPTISREKALVLCGSDSTIYAIIYPLIAGNKEWGAISEGVKITSESTTYLTINIL